MADHASIQVRFVDAETGQTIGETQQAVEALPESFEAATTLEIGDRSFQVVSATPMTAREFRATGQLRLELREVKVQMMDTRAILYSLPSINSAMPAMAQGSTKLGKRVLELHEDDWRQVELVSLKHKDAIESELRAIHRVLTQHRQGHGFTAIHIREAVPSPLDAVTLTFAELRGALSEASTWLEGVAFEGVPGVVEGGFAVRLPSGIILYGSEHQGRVYFLGLHGDAEGAAIEGDARMLAALATRHQLCLVGWCWVAGLGPSVEHFQAWLSGERYFPDAP
jgi:hypothetical protein